MKLKIFSVRDSKVGGYMPPFFESHSGKAIRAFEEAVNDGATTIAKYPADFTLFELGTFDQETGKLESHENPLNLGQADSFVKQKSHHEPQLPFPKGVER